MSDTTFDRIAAAGGAAFAVLALSTQAVAPAAPDLDANAGEVRRYLADNHGRIGVSIVLMALAVLALGLFFGYVHRRLVDTDRGSALPACFLIAGATTIALALAGVLAQGILVQHTGAGIDDSALLVIHRTWQVVAFIGPPLSVSVALALVGARTLQYGVFPRWLGCVALVAAAAGLVTALVDLSSTAHVPAALDFGSFVLACVWFAGMTVHAFANGATVRTAVQPASAQ
jgi:hypothetical protein